MNLIIEQLQEDHRQLVRVLYHLEREVKVYTGLLKGASSLQVIMDILDYIQVYPEIWHHPTEDIIYAVLVEKDLQAADQLAGLMAEHAVLELLTENLFESIDQFTSSDSKALEAGVKVRFVKAVSGYVNRQLSHMEQEQNLLFPLMDLYLDQQDWRTIKQQLTNTAAASTPSLLNTYQLRYREIANQSFITA